MGDRTRNLARGCSTTFPVYADSVDYEAHGLRLMIQMKGMKKIVLLEHNPTFHILFSLLMFISDSLGIQLAHVVGEVKSKGFVSIWAIHFFSVVWLPLL